MVRTSNGLILGITLAIVLYGWLRKVNLYDAFVKGAKEGMESAISILPNLMAMLTAIQLMRASGLLGGLERITAPLLHAIGLPEETAPLMLMRPFSGSGAMAILTELLQSAGADSRAGLTASTLMGSSETIIYTMGIYAAAGKVTSFRYALPAALGAWFLSCVVAGMFYA